MYIGKIFNKYPVNFDMDRKVTIITGLNGSGKTKTLELLNDYFINKGENVLFFPARRRLTITKEDIEKLDTMSKLLNENTLKDLIEKRYDISDPFAFEHCKHGQYINSGYLQLINFWYNIALFEKQDVIVLIDLIEVSLHPLIQEVFIQGLLEFNKIKKLIITTHSPFIIQEFKDEVINIKECLELH